MLKKWMPIMLKMPYSSLYFSLINKLLIELDVVLRDMDVFWSFICAVHFLPAF